MNKFNMLYKIILPVVLGALFLFAIRKAPHFVVKNIEVSGTFKQVTSDEIISASKVSKGTPLFSISLKQIEKNILTLPWVKSVAVRREIPATLSIHVEEREPIAFLLDEKLYFVSKEGVVFKPVEKEMIQDLVVITGCKKSDSIDSVVSLIKFFQERSDFELFGLSEIHYNEATGFSIVTLMGPMEIKLGRQNFAEKIERFKTIWSHMGEKIGKIRGIDLDYEGSAFVKL